MTKAVEKKDKTNFKYSGVITRVWKETFTNKSTKQDFDRIMITVIVDEFKKEYKTSMSVDYAIKYFKFCGVKGSDLKGMECICTMVDKAGISDDGTAFKYKSVKYLNLIDENGEQILLPKEENDEDNLPF